MLFSKKTLLFLGLFGNYVVADDMKAKFSLRRVETIDEHAAEHRYEGQVEHLDIEHVDENGHRELFPLLPGTKCPPGQSCRARNIAFDGTSPMTTAFKQQAAGNKDQNLQATKFDWDEFNNNMNVIVASDDYCTRRAAMARAAGLAAGVAAATVAKPAYAAQTQEVKMGADSGLLVFVPAKLTICKGDTVKWINNKAGPHNVVFDEDAIPKGVDQEAISMSDQLGEEGESFSMTFDTAGTYEYYCEPHRGAGMQGMLTVT